MSTISFRKWLDEQGLADVTDPSERKKYRDYYRKKIYLKQYEQKRRRTRICVNFSSDDMLQLRAKAAVLGMPLSKFVRKATNTLLRSPQSLGAESLTTIEQLLGLCRSDLDFLIETGTEILNTGIYEDFRNRFEKIEESVQQFCANREGKAGIPQPGTPSPLYST